MILGKQALRAAVARGDIKLHDDKGDTLPEWQQILRDEVLGYKDPIALQPASIDLCFGNQWMVPFPNQGIYPGSDGRGPYIGLQAWTDPMLPVEYETIVAPFFDIPAHGFVLVRTREVIGIADTLFAKVEGRSSVGRLGLIVETAGLIDPGFYGTITCELCNVLPNPLRVYAWMRGCQLTVSRVEGSTEGGYTSVKYQGQLETTGTKIHRDFGA